ncbi:hypothetical protein TWF718_008453 [Orbilia javanica]|uniref:Uncharacterized protein n=1 Tax=Orbilia javanica TaxID=47235 RepID=A0AAN8N134_9PEZI
MKAKDERRKKEKEKERKKERRREERRRGKEKREERGRELWQHLGDQRRLEGIVRLSGSCSSAEATDQLARELGRAIRTARDGQRQPDGVDVGMPRRRVQKGKMAEKAEGCRGGKRR